MSKGHGSTDYTIGSMSPYEVQSNFFNYSTLADEFLVPKKVKMNKNNKKNSIKQTTLISTVIKKNKIQK